jgi:hypothetical protein
MAVLSLLPFFLLGLAFLFWIDEKRARQVALPEGTWASMTQA